MRSWRIAMVGMSVAVVGGLCTQVPAYAENSGGSPDKASGIDGGVVYPDSPPQRARATAKQAVADAYAAAHFGSGSPRDYYAAALEYARHYPSTGAPSAADQPRPRCSASQPCKANAVELGPVGQSKSWWCGPATAYMMVRQLAADGRIVGTASRFGKRPALSQNALAGTDYLKAVDDGTYRADLRDGLTRWTGQRYYSVANNPTPERFTADLLMDIDQRYAIAVAALERAGGPHYNHHPANLTVDHWVAAFGYADSGKTTRFADPATTVWPSHGVRPDFSYDTKSFVTRWVRPAKAIVW